MSIRHFETEEEMDADLEAIMEKMEEETWLKEEICEAEHRLAIARDELSEAESELADLNKQLEELGIQPLTLTED